MGTKIKCLKCGDIIEGDKKGHLISCSCGSCYIDETEYYCRVGGDPSQIASINEDNEEQKFLQDEEPEEDLSKYLVKIGTYQNKENKNIFIFLDVDGVLDNETYTTYCYMKHKKPMSMQNVPLDPRNLEVLMYMIQYIENNGYEPKIVLTSTWRLYQNHIPVLKARLAQYGLNIYDYTEEIDGNRGREIEKYLCNENHTYRSYIILDDEIGDLINIDNIDNIVEVNPITGLREYDFLSVKTQIEVLKIEDEKKEIE